MMRGRGPNATVAWLSAKHDPGQLAGAAFLVDPHHVLTCAHVIRDHLGLGEVTPAERPGLPVLIRFDALERELMARVIEGGWWPGRKDMAVLRLDEPLHDLDVAGLALAQPRPRENCYIYGAISGYQSTGQTVYAQMAAQPGVDGRHQLNAPPGGEHGYKIRRGFSGSPIFDELGNTIWGMVVTVETDPDRYVAFCTPAEELRQALRAAQIQPPTAGSNQAPLPEAVEELARDALAALRQEYEQRLSEQREAYERQIQELRQAVHRVAEVAREPANEEPVAFALQRLKQGDPVPAEELLARLLDAAPERTPQERQRAAELARSLGVLAYLDNTDRALRAYQMATRLDPDDTWSWIHLGRLHRRAGNLAAAEQAFEKARVAAERAGDERDVGVADIDLGDVRVARGDLAGAVQAYQVGLDTARRLAAQDPSHTGWQRDLSVSFNKIGDVQRARGDLAAALQAYQDGLAIAQEIAAQDPSDTEWQRDVLVSYDRIGTVQRARGDLDAALQAYQDGLVISARLTAQDPRNAEWQHDLSISFNRIGDVQIARGNLATALQTCQDGLAIRKKLAAQDPSNTEWQYDLGISHERIGDVLAAQGKLDDAFQAYERKHQIIALLAKRDPGNTEWQRDLFCSWDRIGTTQLAHGNIADALESYTASHAIIQRLAAQDPDNAGWQRDLSDSYIRMANIRLAQADLEGRLGSYWRVLAVLVMMSEYGHRQSQRELVGAHTKLTEGVDDLDERAVGAAQESYEAALTILRKLEAGQRLAPADAWRLVDLEARLERLGAVQRRSQPF